MHEQHLEHHPWNERTVPPNNQLDRTEARHRASATQKPEGVPGLTSNNPRERKHHLGMKALTIRNQTDPTREHDLDLRTNTTSPSTRRSATLGLTCV